MASKRRNMFHKNKTQETTEEGRPEVSAGNYVRGDLWKQPRRRVNFRFDSSRLQDNLQRQTSFGHQPRYKDGSEVPVASVIEEDAWEPPRTGMVDSDPVSRHLQDNLQRQTSLRHQPHYRDGAEESIASAFKSDVWESSKGRKAASEPPHGHRGIQRRKSLRHHHKDRSEVPVASVIEGDAWEPPRTGMVDSDPVSSRLRDNLQRQTSLRHQPHYRDGAEESIASAFKSDVWESSKGRKAASEPPHGHRGIQRRKSLRHHHKDRSEVPVASVIEGDAWEPPRTGMVDSDPVSSRLRDNLQRQTSLRHQPHYRDGAEESIASAFKSDVWESSKGRKAASEPPHGHRGIQRRKSLRHHHKDRSEVPVASVIEGDAWEPPRTGMVDSDPVSSRLRDNLQRQTSLRHQPHYRDGAEESIASAFKSDVWESSKGRKAASEPPHGHRGIQRRKSLRHHHKDRSEVPVASVIEGDAWEPPRTGMVDSDPVSSRLRDNLQRQTSLRHQPHYRDGAEESIASAFKSDVWESSKGRKAASDPPHGHRGIQRRKSLRHHHKDSFKLPVMQAAPSGWNKKFNSGTNRLGKSAYKFPDNGQLTDDYMTEKVQRRPVLFKKPLVKRKAEESIASAFKSDVWESSKGRKAASDPPHGHRGIQRRKSLRHHHKDRNTKVFRRTKRNKNKRPFATLHNTFDDRRPRAIYFKNKRGSYLALERKKNVQIEWDKNSFPPKSLKNLNGTVLLESEQAVKWLLCKDIMANQNMEDKDSVENSMAFEPLPTFPAPKDHRSHKISFIWHIDSKENFEKLMRKHNSNGSVKTQQIKIKTDTMWTTPISSSNRGGIKGTISYEDDSMPPTPPAWFVERFGHTMTPSKVMDITHNSLATIHVCNTNGHECVIPLDNVKFKFELELGANTPATATEPMTRAGATTLYNRSTPAELTTMTATTTLPDLCSTPTDPTTGTPETPWPDGSSSPMDSTIGTSEITLANLTTTPNESTTNSEITSSTLASTTTESKTRSPAAITTTLSSTPRDPTTGTAATPWPDGSSSPMDSTIGTSEMTLANLTTTPNKSTTNSEITSSTLASTPAFLFYFCPQENVPCEL
ncbi:hypothetical protein AAG570_005258 [Ranatra chinensis]|uniref:Uncharacterized protein n=1 Tax=Ranatra chinensis TaxID=642074 RepID=A0ABD0Y005_9HEMI